jgi:Ca2+-binding RTX toxin-like protein
MPTIIGTAASELLEGGVGDDTITDNQGGSDILRGGAGNDYLDVVRTANMAAGTIRLEGGDGDDSLTYQGYNASDVIMDGGSGADVFRLRAAAGPVSITTGSGVDTIYLDANLAYDPIAPLTVTDFSTGSGGDRLDWANYLGQALSNWEGANPFASGHVRLLQSGANTLLQIDFNGGGNGYTTLLTFQNTTATNFAAENMGGYPPDGSAVLGQSIEGTANAETLTGTAGNDIINGLGGNDTIDGGAGDDQIDGGDGNDTIRGGFGSDTVNGGVGDDTITDYEGGSDILRGGAGNDYLEVVRTANRAAGTIRLEGGDGDDILRLQDTGGNGAILDGGSGSDSFRILSRSGTATITTGSGADTITIDQSHPSVGGQSITVTDFSTGEGGDLVALSYYLSQNLSNWNGGNPFASGHVRLLQSGADTLLQLDHDGGGNSYTTLLTFQSTTATNFNTFNLGGLPAPGQTITGTVADDSLPGTAGDDVIYGLGGNDVISGLGGDDVIDGGDGADTIFGGAGNDTLAFGFGADLLDGGTGDDRFVVNSVGFTSPTPPSGQIAGGDGSDTIDATGGSPTSFLLNNEGQRFIVGNQSFSVTGVETFRFGGEANLIILTQTTDVRLTFFAGGGADNINVYAGVNVYGEEGDDTVFLSGSFGTGPLTGFADGGGGVDLLKLNISTNADLLTGSVVSGQATFSVQNFENVTAFVSSGYASTVRGSHTANVLRADGQGYANAGAVVFHGEGGDDTLIGESNADTLNGGEGNDIIDGAAGDDVISGGAGNNIIDGGTGWDIVTVSGPASAYRLLADGDNFILKGPDGGDRLTNVEAIRFADGRTLDLARMYGPDVDARAWSDGQIPEALLSGGARSDDRPLVLPGPAGDDFLIAKDGGPEVLPGADEGGDRVWKGDDQPLVLPGAEDVFVVSTKAFDSPEVLPGVDDWTFVGAKGSDLFELLPGLDERTLFTWDPASLHDPRSGQMLRVDEQGLVLDHYSLGNRSTDSWSF